MNEEKNIRYKIGDEVIALKSSTSKQQQQRIKGQKYIVNDVKYCYKCGIQCINIGGKTESKLVDCECGITNDTNGLGWTYSYIFIKADNLEEVLETAISNEDYELASIIRDIKI